MKTRGGFYKVFGDASEDTESWEEFDFLPRLASVTLEEGFDRCRHQLRLIVLEIVPGIGDIHCLQIFEAAQTPPQFLRIVAETPHDKSVLGNQQLNRRLDALPAGQGVLDVIGHW